MPHCRVSELRWALVQIRLSRWRRGHTWRQLIALTRHSQAARLGVRHLRSAPTREMLSLLKTAANSISGFFLTRPSMRLYKASYLMAQTQAPELDMCTSVVPAMAAALFVSRTTN